MLATDRKHGLAVAAVEQVVLVLHHLVPCHTFQLRVLYRLCELLGCEVRRSGHSDLPGAHELVEREQCLLLRHVRVELVGHVDRHALDAEAAQARVDLPAHAGARQATVLAGVHRVVGLGLDCQPRPYVQRLGSQPLSDRRFAPSTAVGVSGVERGDSEVPGCVHDPEGLVPRRAPVEKLRRRADPAEVAAAECNARDRDAAPAEQTLFHRASVASGEAKQCRVREAYASRGSCRLRGNSVPAARRGSRPAAPTVLARPERRAGVPEGVEGSLSGRETTGYSAAVREVRLETVLVDNGGARVAADVSSALLVGSAG